MFETLQKALAEALRKLGRTSRLTEANIQEGVQEVRRALLEADVHYTVVQKFLQRVSERAIGQAVLRSFSPSEQIVKIVYDELVALMGPVDHQIHFASQGPTVLMLCGLQGSGKTTTCAKLALYLKQLGRRPLLVAADLQRPAAVEQLQTLGAQIQIPVYTESSSDALRVCRNALRAAESYGADTLLLDTAGRLHVETELMEELSQIERELRPHEVLLVVDAMAGQVAVEVAKAFNEALQLDGVILTKLDGDARGGAALSVKAVTGVPIKFVGVGEKLDKLELFYPERMASRILGAGDLMTLVEKIMEAQRLQDLEETKRQQEKMLKGELTLEDFRTLLNRLNRGEALLEMLEYLPGGSEMKELLGDGSEIRRMIGIIDSMTPEERRNPSIIDPSRRRRIAAGSGTDPSEVSQLVKSFQTVKPLLREMATLSFVDRFKAIADLSRFGGLLPFRLRRGGTAAPEKSYEERMKERKERKKLEKRRKKKR